MRNKLLLLIIMSFLIHKTGYSLENDTVIRITQKFLPSVECFEYIFSSDSLVINHLSEQENKKNVYKLFLNIEKRKILIEEINKIMSLDTLYEKPVIDGYVYEIEVSYKEKKIKRIVVIQHLVERINLFYEIINKKILNEADETYRLQMTYEK